MRTLGVRFDGCNDDENSKLIMALRELPDGVIEGLSDRYPSSVTLKEGRVLIKRANFGGPLTVHFPEGSRNNVAKKGIAHFSYMDKDYEIHQ
jgi:hypothetical protein